MNPSYTNNYPWDLITGSFFGNLSEEESLQLNIWLDINPSNLEAYKKLREIWERGMEDYKYYRMADENKAWDLLQSKMKQGTKTTGVQQLVWKNYKFFRIAAAAAAFLILALLGFMFISSQGKTREFLTSASEQKEIQLADGTLVTLMPSSFVSVSKGYNRSNRTVNLKSGEAVFDISHQDEFPFIVDAGPVKVEDIGTVFSVSRENNGISVSVIAGLVEVSSSATNELRKLETGMSVSYSIISQTFGEIKNGVSKPRLNQVLPDFNNTPLSEVVIALQEFYGKTIIINDSIGNKRLTANLDGMPFDTALNIICGSLEIKYDVKDSLYILSKK